MRKREKNEKNDNDDDDDEGRGISEHDFTYPDMLLIVLDGNVTRQKKGNETLIEHCYLCNTT